MLGFKSRVRVSRVKAKVRLAGIQFGLELGLVRVRERRTCVALGLVHFPGYILQREG